MKFAIFMPNWVGDAVMATPALRALQREYPDAEFVGVMRPVIADVLEGSGLIDRVLPYHPRSRDRQLKSWRLISRLRAERCDTAVLFPNSLRSAALAWVSGAKQRVGIDRDGRGWMLTDRVAAHDRTTPHPVIDEYLRIAEALGCRHLSREMTLAVSPEGLRTLDQFWAGQPAGLEDRGVVAFNSGGAFGPAKNWPRESFAQLAQRIVDELGKAVLVLCGPAEQEDARWIVEHAQRAAVCSLAGLPPSIGLTKAAVAMSDLLVTTDSGPRHFAAPFGVPVVTLFGPTHIAWSETFYAKASHLQVAVACGPCQQRECPQGHHRCMRDLSVEAVFQAVRQRLSTAASRAA